MILIWLLSFAVLTSSSGSVVVLNAENFEEFIKTNERVLVEFYAPWCGHCQRLAPEYEAAASELENSDSSTRLAKVDATENKELAKRFGVRGYPTLKYFIEGDVDNVVDYTGGREKSTIISWVETQASPAVTHLTSKEALDKFLTKKKFVLIANLAPPGEQQQELQAAAEKLRNELAVGMVTEVSLMEGYGSPSLVLHTQFADPVVNTDEITYDNIMKLFKEERFPPIGEIGPENYQSYMDRDIPLVWIALNPNSDDFDKTLDTLEPFAKERKGKLLFVWVNSEKFAGHIENLGISSIPGFLIIDESTNDKYKFTGDVSSEDDLRDFFTSYDTGSLPMFVKTQPVPEPSDSPVQTVVGSTFSQYAFDSEKAVLMEFYASWCGHCKKLAPEYEKLGTAFKDRQDITIAKLDATENDTPQDIEGFPTLILYGKGCADVSCGETYKGVRDSSSLASWINEKYPLGEADRDISDTNKDEL